MHHVEAVCGIEFEIDKCANHPVVLATATAQARAIENECYVAIAGSVGNLPRVNNMDIQYSQSAVFTPSDFSFPNNGVKAEATPNTEMVLISDVDLYLLKEFSISYLTLQVLMQCILV